MNNTHTPSVSHLTATTGFLRLASILSPKGPLPISRSSWWDGVRQGRFPQPVKLGPRTTAWRAADIADLITRFERGDL